MKVNKSTVNLFFLAAIFFYAAAAIGFINKNSEFNIVWIALGSAMLALGVISRKNMMDEQKKQNEILSGANDKCEIRELNEDEINSALDLSLKTFLLFEAPDYSQEGVKEFEESLNDKEFTGNLTFYGAFKGESLIGTVATRNAGSHIALFFVDKDFQKRGVGKLLFIFALSKTKSKEITVNSSPYAIGFYHKLGFSDTDTEQTVSGIRFVPMIFKR